MNNELINFHHEMFGDIRAIERDGGIVARGKARGNGTWIFKNR